MYAFAAFASVATLVVAVPIFIVFGLGSSIIAVGGLHLPWSTLIQTSFGALTKQVLLAIPMFIFAGHLMLRAGVSRRLVDFSVALVGHLPGGLGLAMVLALSFFAAFCGSVLAAITAVGMILLPRMIKSGYPKPFSAILAVKAGSLEGLIPPSNAAILFSAIAEVPVSKTFAAGLLPAFVLMGLLSAYVVFACRHMERPARATLAVRWQTFRSAIPGLITPVIIMGGIYTGIFTPTEAAAVAATWAIIVGIFVHRELTLDGFCQALRSTVVATAAIFSIIAMASFLSVVLTYTRGPQQLIEFFIDFGIDQTTFLLMVAVICLILGTLIEVVPIFYLTLPVFLPLVSALNIDIYHFYITFTAFVGLGLLTPPVCVGVYTAAAVLEEQPQTLFSAIPPFLAVGIIYGLIMMFVPIIPSFLPNLY